MRLVNVHEAKSTLSFLLAEVDRGEEVVIARAGTPVARLVPYGRRAKRPIGLFDGQGRIAKDFDSFVPPEFEADET